MATARRYVLARRPRGAIQSGDLRLAEIELPELLDGEVQLETLWISLDPAIRGWLDDRPSYLPPVAIGAPVRALGIARVASRPQSPGSGAM